MNARNSGEIADRKSTRGGEDTDSRARLDPDFLFRAAVPIVFLLIGIYFAAQSEQFLTTVNLSNIFRQSAVLGVAAIGLTIVLISGGIDISQGATMALAALTAVVTANHLGPQSVWPVVLGISAGLLVGAFNGFLSEIVKIPAFVATLGVALVVRGFVFVLTNGRSIGLAGGNDGLIASVGRDSLGFIPVMVIVMLGLYGLASVIMNFTPWGLRCYAIGASAAASRVAGIRVTRQRIAVYALAGLLSGVAGVMLAGRLGSATPQLATGAEFTIITAAVLGGTSVYGGYGRVGRTLVGIVGLALLTNGLILTGVDTYYQTVASGAVMLLALAIDSLRTRHGT